MELFIDKFWEQVKIRGKKAAIVDQDGERVTTYEELSVLSGQVAGLIAEKGIGKGSFLPVLMPRKMEYIAAVLGVFQAGCVAVPLSMSYPEERIDYITEECGAPLILDGDFVEQAKKGRQMQEQADVTWQDRAFVVYTSGSTGKPKGIVHNHKSLVHSAIRMAKGVGLQTEDVYLSSAPFHFVAIVIDIFAGLVIGTTIHLNSDKNCRDVRKIESYIEKHGITALYLSPQILKLFGSRSKSLRLVITGSERVAHVQGHGYELYNIYGSSETTPPVTCFRVDKEYENTPVGKPFDGMHIWLVKEDGTLAEPGEVGEICIAGPLADGYLYQEEKTREVFKDNPFAAEEDDRVLYHSNDLGRLLPDGNLVYVNRKDWMVKINGQRVETGEIEALMNQLPYVRTGVVKGFENQYGQTYLCAYYQLEYEGATAQEIRKALMKKLPDYMIPQFFVQLESFPLNQNNKLDRTALKAPEISGFRKEYEAPENEEEGILCRAFEKVLGVPEVGRKDDFFGLGGDSIKVLMLLECCRELTGAVSGSVWETFSPTQVFEGKTPEGMAALIGREAENQAGLYADIEKIRLEKRDFYPLTESQMGVFLECMQAPEKLMYNIPFCFTAPLSVDAKRWRESLLLQAQQYPVFKVSVEERDGAYGMALHPDRELEITIHKAVEGDMDTVKKAFIRPFDLQNDMLVRMALYETEEHVYLLCDMHHIISDGTSVAEFFAGAASVYQGGEPVREDISLFDMALMEQNLDKSAGYRKAEEYFEHLLSGNETDSNLIADRPAGENRESHPAGRLYLNLEGRVSSGETEHFTAGFGITENTYFLGAFAYALAKYTGQADSMFCAVNNGRHNPGLKHTMGMLVKTLPVYTVIDEEERIGSYLQGVQKKFFETMSHDCFPFRELAGRYGVKPDIRFVYQAQMLNAVTMEDEEIPMDTLETGDAQGNLTIHIFKKKGSYEMFLEYRSDLYQEETIENFGNLFIKILEGFLSASFLKEISLVSEEELGILNQFHGERTVYDRSKTVVDIFAERVKEDGERTAVVFRDKRYTYAQIDQLSERAAAYISEKGIGRGDVVSVLIPRGEYMAIASLAVMKTGAAYQPLDPTYPKERLIFMIQDAQASMLIADESLLDLVPEYDGPVLLTKDIPDLPVGDQKTMEAPKPEDTYILLYTSGTTGKPKGCMLAHKNLVAFCNWYCNYFQMDRDSVSSAYASYGFDACMMDMYTALTCGGCICIIPEEMRLELSELNAYMEREHVTHTFMTTQVGRQFAEEIDNKSLKQLLVGGETLVPPKVRSDLAFYNVYGPTECTILSTAYPMDKTREYDNIPIGKPVDNMEAYVVDKQMRRLPVGAVGELGLAGYQISKGYLNRPEQTEKVFVRNPFTEREGYERIYLTGDNVRFLPDGNIQFVGRRDGQVKVRGFRIELSEVAAVIRKFPGIRDVAVVAYDAAAGGKAVAAYVVSDGEVDIQALNNFILDEKPPYMVPAVTMQIEKIPLNQNMKVNRKALPDPLSQENSKKRETARPMSLLEKELMDIVEKILGHGDFGVDENLLQAGLTSLSAMKLAAEIHKNYNVVLEVKDMMRHVSILSMEDSIYEALRMNCAGEGGAAEQSSEGQTPEEAGGVPLTQTQLGVYYDCVKHPGETNYNIPSVTRFPASVSADQLKEAAEQVLSAHPYLNVHIQEQNGYLVQVPGEWSAEVNFVRLKEEELEGYIRGFVKPFEITQEKLARITVADCGDQPVLLMDFHHIIFDGGSMNLFLTEVVRILEGEKLKEETYSYYDFARREKEEEGGTHYREAEKYYTELLSDFEHVTELRPDVEGKEEEGRREEAVVAFQQEPVEQFCRANGLTPAHLFLAAASYTLCRYTGGRQSYICTISNGRSDLRLQNAMGMFVKTLPLAADISGEKRILDFAKEAKESLLDAIKYEEYPFTKLSSDYGYDPQIMYACQLGVLEEMTVMGETIHSRSLEGDGLKFRLSIHIEERDGVPSVCVAYNNALYSETLAESLARSIAVCAQRMTENPEGQLKHLSLVTGEDEKILEEFCMTAREVPQVRLFHQAFERQAALHGEKTALIASDGTFSYRELDERMNRIANALRARGFGRGDTAVVLLSRDSRLITAMYGVMKAGGAYIPCDPDYPAQRIRQITEDSGASLVITSGIKTGEYQNGVDVEELLAWEDATALQIEMDEDDLAYLIYTSGSTGKPKGVMLTHRGIVNYVWDHEANSHVHACVTEGHVMVSVTTVSFDMSLKETAVALCNGLTLVLADEEEANHPVRLAELMRKTKGDIFNATPSRMLLYLEAPEFADVLKECRIVMSGGEAYGMNLLRRLKEVTKARIFNTYGPTEITVSSNAKELTDANEITIGRPLLNYTEYVADSDGNLLPPYVTGELYVGGPGVAKGYLGLESMTRERFVTFAGERVYKTGDYARWTRDGEIIILGRTDNQIKLRGLRIELQEVENALTQHPQVEQAIVVIRTINGAEHLCAYYTAKQIIAVDELKEFLGQMLTRYMIPTAYLKMDAMPMTPNGKIDRNALPAPELAGGGEYEAPVGRDEEVFCGIFARVLNSEKVGATDDFFDLGGTSLMVTSVVVEASEEGYDITYGDVFSHATPRSLAQLFGKEGDIASGLEDLSGYDYTRIQQVLKENTLEAFLEGEQQEIGNVLLTGANGFLGMHILREILERESGKVYCILRKGRYDSAYARLKSMLFYYFENTYAELADTRLFAVEGDVTQPEAFAGLSQAGIDTVINCAANVKHFSSGTDIEDVNVGGALNAIEFCRSTGARLVHISTTSVSGFSVGDVPPADTVMTEQMLYFGQVLDTKYGHSKFLAERAALEAAADGVGIKIMRVGNLSARDTDGEFQMNFSTNSFIGRLKSYGVIGKFPYSMMDVTAEMAPIDSTAKAILALAKTPKACCLFQPYNNHSIYMGDIIYGMRDYGMTITLSEDEDYDEALKEAQKDPEKAAVLSSMIAYQNMGHGKKTVNIARRNNYTMEVLYRLGFHWPTTSREYVSKFVQALGGLGFFGQD